MRWHLSYQLKLSIRCIGTYIDKRTMEIHHTKHHQAYVDNLNKAWKDTKIPKLNIRDLIADLNSLPEEIRTAVRNNGGGH